MFKTTLVVAINDVRLVLGPPGMLAEGVICAEDTGVDILVDGNSMLEEVVGIAKLVRDVGIRLDSDKLTEGVCRPGELRATDDRPIDVLGTASEVVRRLILVLA